MATRLEYLDSFDYGPASISAATLAQLNLRGWTVSGSTQCELVGSGSGLITGIASLKMNPNSTTTNIQRAFTGNRASVSIRWRMAITRSTANGEDLINLYDGGTRQMYVEIANTSGDLQVTLQGGSAGGIVSATAGVPDDNEHDYELLVLFHNSTGVAKLYRDGVQIGSTFNGDTQNTANAYTNSILIGQIVNSTFEWIVDDLRIYYDDGGAAMSPLGPSRVGVKRWTTDTAQEDFTPSTGSDSEAMVDETISDGDSTYLSSVTDAHKTILTGGAVEGTAGQVLGAQAVAVARKTDGASRDLLVGVEEGGTEEKSAAQALTSAYATYFHPFEDTPGGSGLVPSDISDINGLIEANQ